MKIILRFTAVAFAIIATVLSLFILALANSITGAGLSATQVILFAVVSGCISGVVLAYVLAWYLMRKAKKFLFRKLSSAFGSFRFAGRRP